MLISGKKVSELMRDAVDAAIAGVTLDYSKTLDEGTQRAQRDMQAMLAELTDNTNEHAAFIREMRGIMLTQQRELAEVRGQLKAMIQMQAMLGKKA